MYLMSNHLVLKLNWKGALGIIQTGQRKK